MKTNIIPFAIIAIVGIFAVVIVSSIGVSQRADIQNAEENGGETEEVTEEEASDPEALFANSCASCHGGDLTGGAGPDLTTVGASLSAEEIQDIIENGQGTMPPGLLQGQEANEVAAWLAEMK